MVQIELSDPVTVQMRLPVDVMERLKDESRRTMIPLTLVMRKYLLNGCSGDFSASEDRTKSTENVQNIQQGDGDDNA